MGNADRLPDPYVRSKSRPSCVRHSSELLVHIDSFRLGFRGVSAHKITGYPRHTRAVTIIGTSPPILPL